MLQFKNKLAVVLGATSEGGMGEAVATDLAQQGAAVVVSGRNRERADALAGVIGGIGCACDLADEVQIEALMRKAAEIGNGGIDMVVNAAGFAIPSMLRDLDSATLTRSVQGNLIGPMLAMRHAATHLRPGGVFLQFTSISAQQPTMTTAAYAVCKAGLEQALRIAAIEYGAAGIRFVGIAPGIVFTPMTAFIHNDAVRRTIDNITPLGRMVGLDDVTALVRFLVSGQCYETGHIYPVTGGSMLTRALMPQEFVVHSPSV